MESERKRRERMKKNRELKYGTTTPTQKVLYAMGSVGFSFLYMNTSSYMNLYFTDVAKISAGFVAVLMIVARILDGVSDLIMGTIIEKTNTKWGKCRPWMFLGTILLAVGVILLFHIPADWAAGMKNVYAAVLYIFVTVISYTMGFLSYSTLLQRVSLEDHDRNVLGVLVGIFSMLANLIVTVATMNLLTNMGGEKNQGAWTKVTVLYAILGAACILITFFTIKEKEEPVNQQNETRKKETVSIKRAFGILMHSKYFYIYTLLVFFSVILSTMLASGAQYYARDVLGDINLYTYVSLCTLPFILVMPIWPHFFSKYGKKKVISAGLIVSFVSSLVTLIDLSNFPLFLITVAFRYIGISPLVVSGAGMIGDYLDYIEMKHGERFEGIVSSASSFGNKLGTGVGAGLLAICLEIGQYDGSLDVQPQSAINAEIAFITWIPAICLAIAFVILQLWDLDNYRDEIDRFTAKKGEGRKESNEE